MENETPEPASYVPILDSALAAKAGELIAAWSGVQGTLLMLMADLASGQSLKPGNDLIGILPLVGMDPRTQLGMLQTLLHARLGPQKTAVPCKALKRLEKIKKMRDTIAHGVWEKDKKTGRLYVITLKATFPLKYRRIHYSEKIFQTIIDSLCTESSILVKSLQAEGYLSGLSPFHGRYF